MRAVHLVRSAAALLVAALAVVSSPAPAKPWHGITPGVSTAADVVKKFGEPSEERTIETRAALVYRSERVIEGTRQAQFFTRPDGVVEEIIVFPAAQLDRESVEGTYGKSGQKTFTDDFKPVWVYRSLGIMVFFGKDGFVEAIRFQTPQRQASPARRGAGAKEPPPAGVRPSEAAPTDAGAPREAGPAR
jgi:hypothetical protein